MGCVVSRQAFVECGFSQNWAMRVSPRATYGLLWRFASARESPPAVRNTRLTSLTCCRFRCCCPSPQILGSSSPQCRGRDRLGAVPFVPVTFLQVGWSLITGDSAVAFSDQALAPPSPTGKTPATRVVWLVFDAMDQGVTFSARPPTVRLPEMDRLRSQAIYASNAYPPADGTLLSMPALLSGRLVSGSKPLDADELMVTFAGTKEAVGWSTQPNLFSKAREAGFRSAVVGWYLPYCRMITDTLTSCSWQVTVGPLDDRRMTVPDCMVAQIQNVMEVTPFAE